MSKKIAVYLLPPVGLIATFTIYDLLTNQHNLWVSAVGTLGWWLFSFGSEFLSKNWQKILFLACIVFLTSIAGFCIFIKMNS
ncbi:hypothetical protein [Lactobacillus ultunensis]|uniref:hypothetical protein n=1 Tax=Lactobacillus ultunensis TaxID=227945 RepID=UPI001912D9FA|nr:hypothetical protein [Lactobacillus ultunensis]QQP29464.1 hypothetical protein H4B44_05270 [Lactobacillus ultunensis]